MTESFDHFYKLLLIGDQYTGKTSLLRRFTEDKFQTSYLHTIGIDFKIQTVELDGKRIRLQLWDTAGQERFKSITSTYYRGAQGVVFVYDLAERNSFVNIRNWFNDIRQYGAANVEKILVGNKCDMVDARMVSEEEGRKLASAIGARFIETSAKEDINVEQLFMTLVSDITVRKYATRYGNSTKSPNGSVKSGQTSFRSTTNNNLNSSLASNATASTTAASSTPSSSPSSTMEQRNGKNRQALASAVAAAGLNPFQVGAGNTLKSTGCQTTDFPYHRSSCCRFY